MEMDWEISNVQKHCPENGKMAWDTERINSNSEEEGEREDME